jgi:general secretion pathway protein A
VLIVDEAHKLDVDVLEQLRLLTNLETNERKLLQVMLIGRPELRKTLERAELRQLSQRIVARFHMRPLGWREACAYVRHRLAIAGGHAQILPDGLARWVHGLSQGVPRTINLLCDRALLGAWTRREDQLGAEGLTRAAQELGLTSTALPQPWEPSFAVAAIIIVAIFAAAVTVSGYESYGTPSTAAAAATPLADIERLPASSTVARSASRALEPVDMVPRARAAEPAVLPAASAGFVWPDAAARKHSSTLAFAALLQQWGVTNESHGSACGSHLSDDLRCLRGRAGLDELRTLNLPAVLHLKDDAGNRADALLLAIQDDTVLLKIATAQQRMALDDLATRWQGDYSLLWRAPPSFNEPLRLGSRGLAVAWLRKRLARLRGEGEPASPAQAFDSHLQAQVREFQVLERLEPDGAAGIRTLARLAARTDPSVPTLGGGEL